MIEALGWSLVLTGMVGIIFHCVPRCRCKTKLCNCYMRYWT